MRKTLRITMSARPVVAIGGAFSPYGDTLSDAGVALDWISDLHAGVEPLVLRVFAAAGSAAERGRVSGEWLCDANGEPPLRLPGPVWGYSSESREWSGERTWVEAWETCWRPEWMLSAAARCGVDRGTVLLAACACVRAALHLVRRGEERPMAAVEAAEEWAAGPVSYHARGAVERRVAAATHASYAFAQGVGVEDAPTDAEVAVGLAASSLDPTSFFEAPLHAAAAIAYDAAGTSVRTQSARMREVAAMADRVRAHVPTLAVLRAVASSAELGPRRVRRRSR